MINVFILQLSFSPEEALIHNAKHAGPYKIIYKDIQLKCS